jgi:hypothetical protein
MGGVELIDTVPVPAVNVVTLKLPTTTVLAVKPLSTEG